MEAAQQFAMSKFATQADRDAAILAEVDRLRSELEAELAEYRKDAERYRFIRANCVVGRMESRGPNPDFYLNCDEPESEWDAAIDRALGSEKGEG